MVHTVSGFLISGVHKTTASRTTSARRPVDGVRRPSKDPVTRNTSIWTNSGRRRLWRKKFTRFVFSEHASRFSLAIEMSIVGEEAGRNAEGQRWLRREVRSDD